MRPGATPHGVAENQRYRGVEISFSGHKQNKEFRKEKRNRKEWKRGERGRRGGEKRKSERERETPMR